MLPATLDPEVRITHLRPQDLRGRREESPIAWLPLGTLEWHSHHLPLGFDGIKAEALCMEGARRLGGVVFPPMYYGDHRGIVIESLFNPDSGFAMSYDHREKVNEVLGTKVTTMTAAASRDHARGAGRQHIELLERAFWMIRSYGFPRIVAVAGHYPNAHPARIAAERFHAAQDFCRVLAGTEAELAHTKDGDHAGAYETSQLLALRPDLVEMELIEKSEQPLGTMGENPARATADRGYEIVELFLSEVEKDLEALPISGLPMEETPVSEWPGTGGLSKLFDEMFADAQGPK